MNKKYWFIGLTMFYLTLFFFHVACSITNKTSALMLETNQPMSASVDESPPSMMKIPVLMYHHFIDQEQFTSEQTNLYGITVLKKNFMMQMAYLRDHGYTTITTRELLDYIQFKQKLPAKPILITCDDGYLSNYTIMYPILKSMGMKATIFIVGESIDKAYFTFDYHLPKLNWKQAQEMYLSHIIDFQSHTYNSHEKLKFNKGFKSIFATQTPNETESNYIARINLDIERSIQGFKENLGYAPIAFAYPYGEYNAVTEDVLKNNHFHMTFTTKRGFVDDQSSPFLINRIAIHGLDDLEIFEKKLN